MKRIYKTPLIFLLAMFNCSAPAYLTPEELSMYLRDKDNGLTQHVDVDAYSIDVTYRPTDLLIQQETAGKISDRNELQSIRSHYDSNYYFVVSLSKNNKEALQVDGNMSRYSDLVETLSFRMGNYVNLTTSAHDTIPTADFILDRTYGLNDATTLLFVFSKEKTKDKEWVQMNLNEFGLGIGNQRFRFNTTELNSVPRIDFKLSGKPDL